MTNAARYATLMQGKTTDQVRDYLHSHNVNYKTKPHTGEANKPLFIVFSDDSVLMVTIPPTNVWEDEEILGTYTAFASEAEIKQKEAKQSY